MRRVSALPMRDRVELATMLSRLIAFRLLLVIAGFRRAHAVATRPSRADAPIRSAEHALRLAKIARLAARSGLVASPCLAACLALAWRLGRDGFDTTLHLGVRKQGGEFHAHAWLEWKGEKLLDTSDDPFASVASFGREHAS
jgi:hypothetical protein